MKPLLFILLTTTAYAQIGNGSHGSASVAAGKVVFTYGNTTTSAACSTGAIPIDSVNIPGGVLATGSIVEIQALYHVSGQIYAGTGNQYVQIHVGSAGRYPSRNPNQFQLANDGTYSMQKQVVFVTGAKTQTSFGEYSFLSDGTPSLRMSQPSDATSGMNYDITVPAELVANPIPVSLYLNGCDNGGQGGTVTATWHLSVTK